MFANRTLLAVVSNAITKSGTNSFRGSAYAFLRNQNMRGNKVGDYDLGLRAPESTTTYGVTLGGPIIKDKLFFFVNGEYENSPSPITKFRLSDDGVGNKEEIYPVSLHKTWKTSPPF